MSGVDSSGNRFFKCDASLLPVGVCVFHSVCSNTIYIGLLNVDMCLDCCSKYGKVIKPGIEKMCSICLENKEMIELQCKHQFCAECIVELFEEVYKNKNMCVQCPSCFPCSSSSSSSSSSNSSSSSSSYESDSSGQFESSRSFD